MSASRLLTRRPAPRRSLLAVGLALAFVTSAVYLAGWRGTATHATSASGERILLLSPDDVTRAVVSDAVAKFEAAGFTAIYDAQTALQLADSPRLVAFFVTRTTFASVPSAVWRSLYLRNVIVGGLDVSLHDLQPLAMPGTQAGSSRVKFNPDRPIFSFLYSLGGCGRGAMSDWLDNWPNLTGVIQQRALEIATANSRGLSDVDCPADQPLGGNR
jgi:hypothetical protein